MVSIVDTENGYLGVSYIQLIPVLLEAIKEKQSVIKNQSLKIDGLNAELDEKDKKSKEFDQRLKQIET